MPIKAMWIAFLGIFNREVIRVLRIWPQSLLPSAITITLYFMIFGHVIGGRVGQMDGMPYMTYITPGLIMMAVIVNSYSNVVSSVFMARYSRSIEEKLVSPMPNWLIILGYASGGVFRGVVVGLIVTVISSLFAGLHIQHVMLSIFVLLLSSFLFCFLGLINAIFARKFDDTSIVTTFIITPLIYLGGVFYSVSLLPPVWHVVSLFNPIYYVIKLFRYAMLSGNVLAFHLWMPLVIVIVMTFVFFMLCVWLMNKGVGLKS